MLEIQEASAHAAWFATLRAAFRFDFLNRPDGFPGLARRYGLRFTSDGRQLVTTGADARGETATFLLYCVHKCMYAEHPHACY